MSRYNDGDNDDEFWALDHGRWQHNARAVLKSKRGRKALATLREALEALPDHRLIEGALCTVGGPERVPEVTDAEIDAHVEDLKLRGYWYAWSSREKVAESMRGRREEERQAVAESAAEQGYGVCVNGALLWHLLVKDGQEPDAAFAELPSLTAALGDISDTARIAERDAGIAYTLAWELAYRNDETYARKSPEDRYTAFLSWINAELGDAEPATASL